MNKKQRWTTEEDNILVQSIKDNPHNKSQAFRKASTKLNRSLNACSLRWYLVLSNPENKKYVGTYFTMLGEASSLCNREIYRHDSYIPPIKHEINLWNKIKQLLGFK